jgi:hypothetical protein
MTAWNPRYTAYSKANGKSPEEMIKVQPSMAEFIIWVGGQVVEFRKASPESFVGLAIRDHSAFDRFLGIEPCNH